MNAAVTATAQDFAELNPRWFPNLRWIAEGAEEVREDLETVVKLAQSTSALLGTRRAHDLAGEFGMYARGAINTNWKFLSRMIGVRTSEDALYTAAVEFVVSSDRPTVTAAEVISAAKKAAQPKEEE